VLSLAYYAVQLLAFYAVLILAYFVVSLLAYFVERKLAFPAYCFAGRMTGKKREVNIKQVVLSLSSVSSSRLPAHGGKRQLMVQEGRFML